MPLIPPPKSITELIGRALPEQPTWVGPAFLPKGGTCLLGGGAKVGKSFTILEMIRDLVLGNPLFGHPELLPTAEAPRILLFEQELGEWGLELRLNRLFRNIPTTLLQNVTYVSKLPGFALDTYEGYKVLKELVAAATPNIIFLDPIGRMLDGDDADNTVARNFYTHLDKVLGEFPGTSAIISHHFRKPGTDETSKNADTLDMHNFRGASQWVGNPDTLASVSRRHKSGTHGWFLEKRIVTRQGTPPEDFYLEVNAYNTSRVLWTRNSFQTPLYAPSENPIDI